MRTVAILTFDGFNEIDSIVAFHIVGRAKSRGLSAVLASPGSRVTSMNGVTVDAHASLDIVHAADAVLIGSGTRTRELVADEELVSRLRLDPARQLVGAQCSGALLASRLGLLRNVPACTDLRTRPLLEESGVRVLDQPFVAHGNVATAGGCLSSIYLATWVITRLAGEDAAREALAYVAPVGEPAFVERALEVVRASP